MPVTSSARTTSPGPTSDRRAIAHCEQRVAFESETAERLLRGPAWQDQGLVFPNEAGKPMEATSLRRHSFGPLLARAGLPKIRFHELRHTAATLLLGQGVHPKIVSERLGHSRVAITLDLYSHVTPTMQKQAVDAMETLLQASP